jgi:hypothetical protein
MDPIRTLLLARTCTVVLDPDRVASAATRPSRDVDVDRFEDELVQLGFVLSLDLAMTIRRLPHQTIQELKHWIIDTLAKTLGAHRPHVPLYRGFPATTPGDTGSLYLRRVLSWLLTRPDQPCPWCSQVKTVGALDPCGHLVCQSCWAGGSFAGCPICHRRIAMGDPFVQPPPMVAEAERVQRHTGDLRLIHLAFDVVGVARERFERLIARTTPLPPDDRAEIETVIDAMGPKAAVWLPPRIPVKETMAIAVARLWLVSPDRTVMVKATQGHLRTATDVLRVAAVLMGADPALVEPMRLRSIGRGLRDALLLALDRLDPEQMLEDVMRHRGLWKRVGERLHPFERAAKLPNAALAFAVVRETDLAAATFGAAIRAQAAGLRSVRIADDRLRVTPWAGVVETALRAGDVRTAAERLAQRPGELLRRADHLVRVTCAKQPEALADVLAALHHAMTRGTPATLLALAAHIATRGAPWPRRVVFPKGEVLRAWSMPDQRPPLRADAIGSIVGAARGELVRRAESRRHFARAVIDRALADLPVPCGERNASLSKIAWPRGSEVAIPAGATLRLFLHWEEPPHHRVDLDLSVALYNDQWRHVATCDFTNLVVDSEARLAVHSGDLTSGPPPLGASEFVDLQLDGLAAKGVRHAVMVVFSYNSIAFDRLTFGFAGLMVSPQGNQPFDPRSVMQRFDLAGRSVITVPITIDLETRRLRWLDVHIKDRGALHQVGGYRVALAHIGKDFSDLGAAGARATLWDVACIHAAARANVIYIRERDGRITMVRRRDGEAGIARLGRLYANEHDGQLAAIPPANAPTWVAVLRDDLAIPAGSAGYVLDARTTGGDGITRVDAGDLVTELAAK